MHAIVRSPSKRIFSVLSRNSRRCSTSAAAAAAAADPSSSLPPGAGAKSKPWNFLKFGLIAALTGGSATAGYATYAYSLDEVDLMTKAFRAAPDYTVGDDAPAVDKFKARLYSSAITVSAKLVDFYLDTRQLAEEHIRGYTEPTSDKLLPDLLPEEQGVFTIVLDLNETLIYSDWKRDRGWATLKRPGVDFFLEHLAHFYEIVVYSDQLSMYVDPVIERLDQKHCCIRHKLSRGDTKYVNGKHYRDLSALNRDPRKVIYISGHALESSLQPQNSMEIKPWKGEAQDTALVDLIPFLDYVARHRPADIRAVLASYQGCDIAKEFVERSKGFQRRMQEQKPHGFWRH